MSALKPSLYRLPQRCGDDRQRARRATLALQRTRYQFTLDPALTDPVSDRGGHKGEPGPKLELPPRLMALPAGEKFTTKKIAGFAISKVRMQLNRWIINTALDFGLGDYRGYAGLSRLVDTPRHAAQNWLDDADFARQRLLGCNPNQLERCDGLPHEAFREPVEAVLAKRHGVKLAAVLKGRRLFKVSYPELEHRLVQASVHRHIWAAIPTALFYASPKVGLTPLAIQLKPHDVPNNPVFTPLSRRAEWLYARCQVQAADGVLHEGVHHLLNTHLVSEIFAVASARQLHPNHPLSQLLTPHFQFTLAINDQARGNLLTVGGPIDRAVGIGIGGVLATVAQRWAEWDFWEESPMRDLERRGVDDRDVLPGYYYRDDAVALWTAIYEYVRDITAVWYTSDQALLDDFELQAWAAEIAADDGGRVPGFPGQITDRKTLHMVLAEIIFRASALHAAVNNGQYERYGWIPYSPAALRAPPPRGPDGEPFDEYDLWWCMPNPDRSRAQMGMAWVLSSPTHISLVRTGNVPAFDPDLNPRAAMAVGMFRRQLREISAQIRRRNAELQCHGKVPYTYLDPYNIARSIEV